MPYIKALGLIASDPGVINLRNLTEDDPRNISVKYCRNIVEIGQVVSEEKIFKDFPMKKLISPRAGPF